MMCRAQHITHYENLANLDQVSGRRFTFAGFPLRIRGGHLLCLKREDGSGIMRPQIAIGKAWGSLGMGFGSREVARRAAEHPTFFGALFDVSGGRMLPAPGGVLVRTAEGELLGAVGVTGDNSDNDELCALHGIEAAGLV